MNEGDSRMQQYNMLQAFFMSFYSRKLYRDVAVNWGGKTFWYLFLLLLLSWIFAVYQAQSFLNISFKQMPENIISQIPIMTIKDGKLITPQNHPYIITDPKSHANWAIIDTSGQYQTLDQAKTPILITQTEIYTQTNPNEIKENKIPNHLNITLVPEKIKSYLQYYSHFVWIPIFIFALLGSYFYRIIQVLLYSIIGKIFSAIGNFPLTYSQIVQITMIAITPVIVIATILDGLGVIIKYQFLLYFVLAMLYMFYGIVANKKLPDTQSTTISS